MTEVFFTAPKVIQINGVDIEVKTVVIKNLAKFVELAVPVFNKLQSGDLLSVVLNHLDSIIGMVLLTTNANKEWLMELDTASVLQLINEMVQVNLDFFTHRLAPQITALSKTIQAGHQLSAGLNG
jgi:hypothetical protein